jgi:hypothetical protein
VIVLAAGEVTARWGAELATQIQQDGFRGV